MTLLKRSTSQNSYCAVRPLRPHAVLAVIITHSGFIEPTFFSYNINICFFLCSWADPEVQRLKRRLFQRSTKFHDPPKPGTLNSHC
jgi:hypothetical protein